METKNEELKKISQLQSQINYYIEKQEMEKVLMISITIVMEKKIHQL